MTLKEKLHRLKEIISGYKSCIIAFSGGVDSTLLLRVAKGILPKNKILAVTAVSLTYPEEELRFSKVIAKELGVRHKIIKTEEFKDKKFIFNPINRCYFCKKELFSKLKKIAVKNKLNFVLDASNISDESDFRPGDKAKKELKVCSPLLEAGFNKEDIRALSKILGLRTWNKQSLACLASRIPYGREISSRVLKRINKAEVYLRNIGFSQVRVRHYDGLCRIEVLKKDTPRLIHLGDQIVDRFKALGYNYVTVDLEGYRTGSMNPALPKQLRDKFTGKASHMKL